MSKRTPKEPSVVQQVAEKTGAASQVRAQFAHYQEGSDMNNAAKDVLAERQRQISVEGWTPRHDDEHGDGSMAVAAAYYALGRIEGNGQVFWPWDRKWCKFRDERSNLVRAAALLLAEIERLDRAKERIRPDGFPTWICSRCTSPGYCSGSLQGCDIEEINK